MLLVFSSRVHSAPVQQPPSYATHHHQWTPPSYVHSVTPKWIIHRIPPLIPVQNLTTTTTIATTSPDYHPLSTTTTTSHTKYTPVKPTVTTKSPTIPAAADPTKKKLNKSKNLIRFTEEQKDMMRSFVVTDAYKSEEITEAPTTKIDMTIEYLRPYKSKLPPIYFYYY